MIYRVEITKPAQTDMIQLYSYIADTMKEPRSARRVYTSIRDKIMSLDEMPERYAVIDEPPYNEIGVRRMLIENYIVFYVAHREQKLVTVLRVVYNRREWRNILGLDQN